MKYSKEVCGREWLEARRALLKREKEFTRLRDELTAARMQLPRVKVERQYIFQSSQGPKTLSDLFGTYSQLIVQHFMFADNWDEGCVSCSFWADSYDGLGPHLAARDIAMVVVSNASVDKLQAYRNRMGWSFQWLSAGQTTFNSDFAVSFSDDELQTNNGLNYNFGTTRFKGPEAPGLSVFKKEADGTVFHTYSTYGRGLDMFNVAYQLMDVVPKGRDEAGLEFTMAWLKRRDEYSPS